jgi:hypothetical protein
VRLDAASMFSGWKPIAWLLLSLLSAPALVSADDTEFGEPGQRVLSGGVGLELVIGSGFESAGFRVSDGVERDIGLSLAPSLLYFIVRDLAIGISPEVSYADVDTAVFQYSELELEARLGFGWNVPLADRVSVFAQLWLGPGYMHRRYEPWPMPLVYYSDPSFSPPEPDYTLSGWFAAGQLLLPVHFQLGDATFVAIGPRARLRWAFEEGTRLFRFGVTGAFGGFF